MRAAFFHELGGGWFTHHFLPKHPMTDFIAALGLACVIEGMVLVAFPHAARRAAALMTETPDEGLRIIGLFSAVSGLVMLWLVRG
jgi:uncharacterized protein